MKNILKIVLALLVSLSFYSSVSADGGWSEDEGYWSNSLKEDSGDYSIGTRSVDDGGGSANPQHLSSIEHKHEYGVLWERVHAQTKWLGQRHYTRAYGERFGVKVGDTGKVYGMHSTSVTSGWFDFVYTAKSFYGK